MVFLHLLIITNYYLMAMKKIKYRLVFNRKGHLSSDGKALIQIEAYLNRRRCYFTTHIYVSPEQWNSEKQQICAHANAEGLNWMLAEHVVQLEQMEIELWKSGEGVSLESLRRRLVGNTSPQFLPFMLDEIARGVVRESTRRNRLTTFQLLREYDREVTFERLTHDFVSKFEAWMVARGYHTNTVAKHLSHLRIYVNVAILKGMMSENDNPFRKRLIARKPCKHVHLTPHELDKLERVTFVPDQNHLQTVRDAFLFCCYTGLRYSDFVRLTEANIQRGVMHTWVSFECHKTGAQVRLPVDMLFGGKALRLLDRYADNLSALFHLPNNSVVDKQLLTIARLAGVRKHFSFHSARHTNATLLLAQGVSVTTVQKLLGHKNVKTTMGYCDVIDRTIINELRRVAGNGK